MLMEAGLVDGEEAATIQSDYVQASCIVTSSTARMSFDIGERGPSPRFSFYLHVWDRCLQVREEIKIPFRRV